MANLKYNLNNSHQNLPLIETIIPGLYVDVSLEEMPRMGDKKTWRMMGVFLSKKDNSPVFTTRVGSKTIQTPLLQEMFSISNTSLAYVSGPVDYQIKRAYESIGQSVRDLEKGIDPRTRIDVDVKNKLKNLLTT